METPCDTHSFDCIGSNSCFVIPENDQLHFCYARILSKSNSSQGKLDHGNKTIYGPLITIHEMQITLYHKRIDILKM